MKNNKVKYLKNKFNSLQLDRAIKQSHKEETTKMLLIQPFLEALGFVTLDNLIHEYSVKSGSVDIAVRLNPQSSSPDIFIECKHTDNVLGAKVINQLNKYCETTSNVKLGITTNGVKYDFFIKNNKEWSHMTPFFSFNLKDYDNSDLEVLCLFCKDELNIPTILQYAEEVYFGQAFENAIVGLVQNPTHDFLKEIYKMMGGKVANDRIKKEISALLNVYSLESVCERLHVLNTNSNHYVFTTEKEKMFFNIVQGFCAVTNLIQKKDLPRIGYKDMKHQFNIVVDDNSRNKTICFIEENKHSYNLHVQGKKFVLNDIDIISLDKYKKEIIASAKSILDNE